MLTLITLNHCSFLEHHALMVHTELSLVFCCLRLQAQLIWWPLLWMLSIRHKSVIQAGLQSLTSAAGALYLQLSCGPRHRACQQQHALQIYTSPSVQG